MAAASSAAASGAAGGSLRSRSASLVALEALALALGTLGDVGGGFREILVELRERGAGIALLPDAAERHGELEEAVRALAALRVSLVALGEGGGGVVVVAAH